MEEDGSHNKLQQQLPAPADVDAAGGLEVLRADGTAIPFRKIFSGDSGDDTDATDASHDDKTKTKKRVLVIFVRHFFCGVSNYLPYLVSILPSLGCIFYIQYSIQIICMITDIRWLILPTL